MPPTSSPSSTPPVLAKRLKVRLVPFLLSPHLTHLAVGQLPQTAYFALGTPYSYFGLGRTNNYVENLFIGSTRRQPEHFINVEGLIPNSQVVLNPYQPEGRLDPASWSKELYLHPGDWIPWVTVTLGAAILLLGVVVLVLHFNEKVSPTLLPHDPR